jgi:hypothetical protein
MFRDTAVAKLIDSLTWQAKTQWMGRDPLDRPKADVMFFVCDQRSDIDNKWTTVLDCLTKAGVLINDNVKHGPRPVTYDWQMVGPLEERVEIDLN